MLYDPSTHDLFDVEKKEYVEALEGLSEEFQTALRWKALEAAQNVIALYGKSMEDPRMLIDATSSFFRFAISFALVNGYVTLTEKAANATGEALPEQPIADVIALHPNGDAS